MGRKKSTVKKKCVVCGQLIEDNKRKKTCSYDCGRKHYANTRTQNRKVLKSVRMERKRTVKVVKPKVKKSIMTDEEQRAINLAVDSKHTMTLASDVITPGHPRFNELADLYIGLEKQRSMGYSGKYLGGW